MTIKDKNFMLKNIGAFANLNDYSFKGNSGKYFCGTDLGLTGCEVSLNCLPAGKAIPFLHTHKQNEELYIVTAGNGTFVVDGKEFPVQEGSLIRISPAGERGLQAGNKDLYFICIQAKENSLTQATLDDGVVLKAPTPWAGKN